MTLWRTLFGFEGRIGRSVFWLSALAVLLIDLSVVAVVSDWIHTVYLSAGAPHRPGGAFVGAGFGLLAVLAVSIWIGLALKVKRAHDLDHSGWWLAIGLIPIYGVVRLTIDLGFHKGSARRNRFGNPLGFVDEPAHKSTPEPEIAPPTASNVEGPAPEPYAPQKPEPPGGLWTVVLEQDHVAAADQPLHAEPTEPLSEGQAAELIDGGGPADAAAGVALAATTKEYVDSPKPVHPLMLWGANYRADPDLTEFTAFAPAQETSSKPEAQAPPPEPTPESAPEPPMESVARQEPPPAAEPAPLEPPQAEHEGGPIDPIESVAPSDPPEAVESAPPASPPSPVEPPEAEPPLAEPAHPERGHGDAPQQESKVEPRSGIKLSEMAWTPASSRDSFTYKGPVTSKPEHDPFKLS
jgi:uncharacterized membrane protein YhaH (DUF805 family)